MKNAPVRTAIVINTHARRAESADSVEEVCASLGIAAQTYRIDPKGIQSCLSDLLRQGVRTFVIGGGDGTWRSAVQYLCGERVRLLLLPLGTTNNFARSLGIPMQVPEAIALLRYGEELEFFPGVANGIIFCNAATVGASAHMAAEVTPAAKRSFGRAAYGWFSLRAFGTRPAFEADVQIDDQTLHMRTHQLLILNSSYHSGVRLTAECLAEQPRLAAHFFGDRQSRWQHLKNFSLFLLGQHRRYGDSTTVFGTHIALRTHPDALPVELDGEPLTQTPVTFGVHVESVTLLRPVATPVS